MSELLFAPSVLLFAIAYVITQLSPSPQRWSRPIIVVILLVLTLRYVLWRFTTLNFASHLNSAFSLGLLLMELLVLSGSSIQLALMLRVRHRNREADHYAIAVLSGKFTPTVDIFIPTYNESSAILRRTIVGVQALEYAAKTVYLLDDGHRAEVQQLAETLGCEYITRSERLYAKAGNLNHALAQTQGDLIAVFDADFVPTQSFLTRTVGFFQNSQIGLVQTPQSFYNADAIARNLGLEAVLPAEEEVFYRQIQPLRDGAGSVVCAGTSFVVRRSALEEVGAFVTRSLSEDYFTGVRLSAAGYELVYLNEKLSAGLAAETIAAHVMQRSRWAQGTLQAFFIPENPLTIPGLTLLQRLAHLEGLLHWFTSLARVGFLLMPIASMVLGIVPIDATWDELMQFFVPYYLLHLTVFSWLNERSRAALFSDVYSLILAFPIAITTLRVLCRPFSGKFRVTPKGIRCDRNSFNWKLAAPLIGLLLLTLLGMATNWREFPLTLLWSVYNLIMIGISLFALIDAPRADEHVWFTRQFPVRLRNSGWTIWGTTLLMSEAGARIAVPRSEKIMQVRSLQLELPDYELTVWAEITQIKTETDRLILQLRFLDITLTQYRTLVKQLFCRPRQWQSQQAPSELHSLILLLKVLFFPRILFNPDFKSNAIAKL